MEYRKIGDNYYVRMDRGDEIISNQGMLELVSLNGNIVRDDDGKLFHHTHALFSFKGGNRDVDNIVGGYQDGQHGLRATLLPSGGRMAGGHLKATTVLYTAEIELRPTVGGAIGRKFDPETGTGFWAFKD